MPTKKGKSKQPSRLFRVMPGAVATGQHLDFLADMVGISRQPGEDDNSLRTRVRNEAARRLAPTPQGANS